MKPKKLLLLFIFPLLCLMNTAWAAEYTISSDSELEALTLSPGDIVTWQNGTYSDQTINFTGNGTAANPIILRAETEGGVIFTGESPAYIYGTYLEMEGFYWNGGIGTGDHVNFRRSGSNTDFGVNCTLRNCAFNNLVSEGDEKSRWIVLYGTQNVIENCSFVNKHSTGAAILVELRFQELMSDPTCQHQIKNNYFYNITPKDGRLNSGDCEAIRIGVSSNQSVDANCTVEGNYFQEADGENEIITNKSANNIYKYNTFRNCRGSLVMRHGSGAWVEGNFFLGEGKTSSGGIRISDSFHTIINNYFQDLNNNGDQWNNAITIVGGGESTGGSGNGYQNVDDILIAFNTVYNCDDPIYYNDRSSYIPTGIIANNLFHSTSTNAINGEISDIGSKMVYISNIADASNLGISDAGLSAENINFELSGEIYKPSVSSAVANTATGDYNLIGTDIEGATRPASNKDIGAHEISGALSSGTKKPITNGDVGTSVGCCFLNASGVSVSGCSLVVGPSLSVNPTSLIFNSETSEVEVGVLANVDWIVSDDAAWISLNTSSGSNNGTITVTVSENTTGSPRTGALTFSSNEGNLTAIITVTQDPFIPVIEVAQSIINFNRTAGQQTIAVESNVNWSITKSDDWFSVSPTYGSGNGEFEVTVTDNTSGFLRTGTLLIKDNNSETETTVTISQSETNFNPSDAESLTIVSVTGVGTQPENPDVLPENVNDDDVTTRWSGESNDGSAYLDLDVECPRVLTSVEIYFHKGAERTSSFAIELSTNGVDFIEYLGLTTSEQIDGYQEFVFTDLPTAQYVRIVGYGNSANDWNSYEEINVYGDNSANACTVTNTEITFEAENTIRVYPNPTTGLVHLSQTSEYIILTYYGQKIDSGEGDLIDLSTFPEGIYFIKSGDKIHKVIKN